MGFKIKHSTVATTTRIAICATLFAMVTGGNVVTGEMGMGKPSLEGTWTLKAADEILKDGTRVPQFGDRPQGLLIVDAAGRYSLQIFRNNRPRFAQADKTLGTAQEFRAAELSMNSHYGSVEMDPSHHTLIFHIALASFPNWNGTVQVRQYTLSGNLLSYQIAPSATGSGKISVSVWQRIDPPSTQSTAAVASDP